MNLKQKPGRQISKNTNLKPYRYRNSRPFKVFGLAMAAAIGVLLPVWGAFHFLQDSVEEERLAEPPNLKELVQPD